MLAKSDAVPEIQIGSRQNLGDITVVRDEPLLQNRVRDRDRRSILEKELAKMPSRGLLRRRGNQCNKTGIQRYMDAIRACKGDATQEQHTK